ncbi:MAG: hypothetical protein QXD95_02740 [Nitrososphaeria archaeon]
MSQIIRATITITIPKTAHQILLKLHKSLQLDISSIVEGWLWKEYLEDNFESLLDYYPSIILFFQDLSKKQDHRFKLYLHLPPSDLPLPLNKLLPLVILKNTYPYLSLYQKKKEVK